MFVQFMAIGDEDDFLFLRRLDDLKGRVVDNAGFFAVPDVRALSDEELYDKVMIEFPAWLQAARAALILGT